MHAAPDGDTLLIHHNGMATAPALYRKLPHNPQTDCEHVRQVELGAEFVADAKLTPEGLRSWLKQETERWGPVIKAAGVYAE